MKKKTNPVKTKKIEVDYARKLSKVARHVGNLISLMTEGLPPQELPLQLINNIMQQYADSLIPWATRTAFDMITATSKQDENAWYRNSEDLSNALKREIKETKTGDVMRSLVTEQVQLIRSIPIEAAMRVHELSLRAIEDGTRSSEIAKEIENTTGVCKSRATLIARTEVARTSSKLTEARALSIGATQYIWKTSHDSDVRHSHKEMEGKVCTWTDPPLLSDGQKINPGCTFNCRCYAMPIIPDRD